MVRFIATTDISLTSLFSKDDFMDNVANFRRFCELNLYESQEKSLINKFKALLQHKFKEIYLADKHLYHTIVTNEAVHTDGFRLILDDSDKNRPQTKEAEAYRQRVNRAKRDREDRQRWLKDKRAILYR